MTDHPLTDKICEQLVLQHYLAIPNYPKRVIQIFAEDIDGDDMRTAADWQLEQVMQWLDENVANYHYRHYYDTGEYPRPNRRWDRLTEHLKEAMRPTQEDS